MPYWRFFFKVGQATLNNVINGGCGERKHEEERIVGEGGGEKDDKEKPLATEHEISSHVNCLSLPYHMTFLFVYTFLVAYFCCVYILLARGNARAFY